jgi:hypothetical protein
MMLVFLSSPLGKHARSPRMAGNSPNRLSQLSLNFMRIFRGGGERPW